MTAELWIALSLGLGLPLLASAVTYGVLKQKVEDGAKAREEDKLVAQREIDGAAQARGIERGLWEEVRRQDKQITEMALAQLRDRVAASEETAKEALTAAGQVAALTAAVEHLTERLGAELKHQSELFQMQTQTLADQIRAIGHDQKNLRQSVDGLGRRTSRAAAKKPA